MKNTKLSEVKRVMIPVAEPKIGDVLEKAMILAGESLTVASGALGSSDKQGSGGISSLVPHGGISGALGS